MGSSDQAEGAGAFDFLDTFVHLDGAGAAERVPLTPAFWKQSTSGKYDRLCGAYDFSSSRDLHSTVQEVHPEADEVLFLVAGAIDVLLQEADGERCVALEPGQAAIVPRGVWHRLVMRQPGRIVFVNSRTGMQTRKAESA